MALAAIATSVEGFSPGISRTTTVATTQLRKSNPALQMATEAQDEVAKLQAMAAKAREDAARLAKVRGAEYCRRRRRRRTEFLNCVLFQNAIVNSKRTDLT